MAEHKNLAIEVKAEGETGSFTGVLSTYDNVDQAGDLCVKGCYAKDIALNGKKRPLLWQHNPTEPIGSFEITDTEKALVIAGKFNLDVAKGREAYALTKNGDINGLSIGYATEVCSYDSEGHRLLQELKLYEGSVVTFPCNTEATLTAVKGESKMDADKIADIEKRLKACEEELAKRAKADEDPETEGEEKEDPEKQENPGSEEADEEGQKALLAAIEHLTTTIKTKE